MSRQVPSAPVFKIERNCSTDNIATNAWAELEDSVPGDAQVMEVFNGSGSILMLAIGSSGAESELPVDIFPGGNSVPIRCPFYAGQRITAKALDVAATTGYLILNFYR